MQNYSSSNFSLISDYDIYLFKGGNHFKIYEKLGAHIIKLSTLKNVSNTSENNLLSLDNSLTNSRNGLNNLESRLTNLEIKSSDLKNKSAKLDNKFATKESEQISGVYFAVWAPNAQNVSVVGDFNYWDKNANPLGVRWDGSGIWEGFIPGIQKGALYKFYIKSKIGNFEALKSDPVAFYCETPPKTASIVWDLSYNWNDSEWLKKRHQYNNLNSPFSIYEIHFGSFKKVAEQNYRYFKYNEIAEILVEYLKKMGFTHVEFLPLMEHPFYGSWGYQTTGYFAPTSRYGTPQELMQLIDILHQNDIGVILDWVPSHFPNDPHGLAFFDGTELYEHHDPKKGFHPDWKSLIFNYGRNEVKEFLISSALFWFEKYHIDALRIDAVASMLYLDYSRKEGEWVPNKYGGRENLEAIDFIKKLNEAIYSQFPDVQTIAEESTAWPAVSKPVYLGGLGFGMKWNMGWMHDTLKYFSKDPIYRKHHHNDLTFTFWYAFSENYILPLSHDEVVYGKKSLIEKMPGDLWQKFANLRLLFSYMFAFPGKKLIFMGGEIAQFEEWSHELEINWDVLNNDFNKGVQKLVTDLNNIYKNEKALHKNDFNPECFEWINFEDAIHSTLFFLRKYKNEMILVCLNFTPTPRYNYRVGVPVEGEWKEFFNSDSEYYGGSGHGNFGLVSAKKKPMHGKGFSVVLTLPPLAAIYLKKEI